MGKNGLVTKQESNRPGLTWKEAIMELANRTKRMEIKTSPKLPQNLTWAKMN